VSPHNFPSPPPGAGPAIKEPAAAPAAGTVWGAKEDVARKIAAPPPRGETGRTWAPTANVGSHPNLRIQPLPAPGRPATAPSAAAAQPASSRAGRSSSYDEPPGAGANLLLLETIGSPKDRAIAASKPLAPPADWGNKKLKKWGDEDSDSD